MSVRDFSEKVEDSIEALDTNNINAGKPSGATGNGEKEVWYEGYRFTTLMVICIFLYNYI